MTDVYIYDHVRSPRGKGRADGALSEVTPVQLAAQMLQAVREIGRLAIAGAAVRAKRGTTRYDAESVTAGTKPRLLRGMQGQPLRAGLRSEPFAPRHRPGHRPGRGIARQGGT